MSRIDELIRELCPDGVPYLPLGQVVAFQKGEQLKAEDRIDGPYPVVTAGRTSESTHRQSNYGAGSVSVSSHGAYAGHINYWAEPIWLSNNVFLLAPSVPHLDSRFLFFALQSRQQRVRERVRGGGVPYMNARDLAPLRIPVPPLEVQREIVRVLDQFTQLEAELEAELEARRRQYDYYFRRLLSFAPGEAEELTLGDIGRVSMCKRIFKNETSDTGEVPFFKIGTFGGEPDAYISRELFDSYRAKYSFPKPGDVLISAAGTIGRTVTYNGEAAYFQDSNIVWLDHDESIVSNAYLNHWYRVVLWATDGGTIKRLYNANLLRAKILVPPRAVQARIVETLDKFHALVNDLSVGLPAELAARRKQYEYYRDKLLTFKELAA